MNTKPIKIHWVTPSGKEYEDVLPMTYEQYDSFVQALLKIKNGINEDEVISIVKKERLEQT